MTERKVLTADEGKLLTNGETYAKVVYLGEGADASAWREVDESEYTSQSEVGEEF